jgi:hypothetical protein
MLFARSLPGLLREPSRVDRKAEAEHPINALQAQGLGFSWLSKIKSIFIRCIGVHFNCRRQSVFYFFASARSSLCEASRLPAICNPQF